MFNTINKVTHNHTTEVREVIKEVNIHRAPTDESIKLFKEMYEKANQNILASYTLHNTYMKVNIHFLTDYLGNNYKYVVRFKLNEEIIQGEFEIDRSEIKFLEMNINIPNKVLMMVYENIGKLVAERVLREMNQEELISLIPRM